MNVIISSYKERNILQIISFVSETFIVWILVFIFVNLCHVKIKRKINQLRYFIATNNQKDETKGNLLKLLDLMANVHVTAGHLIRFDKEIILPFIGSLFTYTFLFSDKFDVKIN